MRVSQSTRKSASLTPLHTPPYVHLRLLNSLSSIGSNTQVHLSSTPQVLFLLHFESYSSNLQVCNAHLFAHYHLELGIADSVGNASAMPALTYMAMFFHSMVGCHVTCTALVKTVPAVWPGPLLVYLVRFM